MTQDNVELVRRSFQALGVGDFEAARQGRTTVQWESAGGDYETKLTTMISAGTPPAVVDLTLDQFPNCASQGVMRTLEPFARRDGKDFSLGDFYPRLVDAMRWLVGEESFSGQVNNEEDVRIEHTKQQDLAWFYSTIFGVPALVLGVGLFFRRRALSGGVK